MTAMTQEKVAALHKDLAAACKAVAEKHGFNFADARMTYYPEQGLVKWNPTNYAMKAITGDVHPVYVQDLAKFGRFYNFNTSTLGKTIQGRTGPEEFVGMKSAKWAITKTVDATGKVSFWKKDPYVVAQLLGTMTAEDVRVNKQLQSV